MGEPRTQAAEAVLEQVREIVAHAEAATRTVEILTAALVAVGARDDVPHDAKAAVLEAFHEARLEHHRILWEAARAAAVKRLDRGA